MRAFVFPAILGGLVIFGVAIAAFIVNGNDVIESASAVTSTTTTMPSERTTTTTVPVIAPPATLPVVVDEEANDSDAPAPPELTKDLEVAQLGETFIRYRIRSSEPTAYIAEVRKDGEVVNASQGVLAAGEVTTVRVDGLEPGTIYDAQATLVGPPAVQTSVVEFRTDGSEPDPVDDAATVQVEMIDLRVSDLQHDQVQFDYFSNVCANGSFIIVKQETGEEVGRNNGHPNGCIVKHLGVPGIWTPRLTPETTYVVLVTLEANGEFRGRPYGNTVTESLVITTPPRPTPADPSERTTAPIEFGDVTQMETDASSVRVDFTTNVCTHTSFVVREVGGEEVGRHDGFPRGCATEHSAIAGSWTPSLEANTSYVLILSAEADGPGQGDGNVATNTITVRTAPALEPPADPVDEARIVAFETRPDGDSVTVSIETNICTSASVLSFEQAGAIADEVGASPECSTSHDIPSISLPDAGNAVLVITVEGEERVPGEPNRASAARVIER